MLPEVLLSVPEARPQLTWRGLAMDTVISSVKFIPGIRGVHRL